MRTFLLSWAATMLSGCGAGRDGLRRVEDAALPLHVPESAVDPLLAEHVDAFRTAAATHGRSLDEPDRLRVVLTGEPDEDISDGGEVGLCTRRRIERPLSGDQIDVRTVLVLRALAPRAYALRRTVFHELGHCLLGLGHDSATSARSIMAARFVANLTADERAWDALVAELFGAP